MISEKELESRMVGRYDVPNGYAYLIAVGNRSELWTSMTVLERTDVEFVVADLREVGSDPMSYEVYIPKGEKREQ